MSEEENPPAAPEGGSTDDPQEQAPAEKKEKKPGMMELLPPLVPILLDEESAPNIQFDLDSMPGEKQTLFDSKPLFDDLKKIVPKHFPVGFAEASALEDNDEFANSGLGLLCLKLGRVVQLIFIYFSLLLYPLGMLNNYMIQYAGMLNYHFVVVPGRSAQVFLLKPAIEATWRMLSPILCFISLLIKPFFGLCGMFISAFITVPIITIINILKGKGVAEPEPPKSV